jgi:hypothetical protein
MHLWYAITIKRQTLVTTASTKEASTMWTPYITELWQITEQETMHRAELAAARRAAAREAGTRHRHVPAFTRIRRDRRDSS